MVIKYYEWLVMLGYQWLNNGWLINDENNAYSVVVGDSWLVMVSNGY